MSAYHEPVMAEEVLRLLAPRDGALYLDGTVGGGGHAARILSGAGCNLVAVDIDPQAIEEAGRALAPFGGRVRFVLGNFADLGPEASAPAGLDGALLDLGVSSRQIDDRGRGFTFARGAPLDMRMGGGGASAAVLLAASTPEELARLFSRYGEVPGAASLARAVARRSSRGLMATSDDLVAALTASLGRSPSPREKARVFQAVRIAVNGELESLARGLDSIRELLASGAVFVVISYHSLEDRIVKRAFRRWSGGCSCPPRFPACACGRAPLGNVVTRKPVRPTEAEAAANPRARSARLRAWRRAA